MSSYWPDFQEFVVRTIPAAVGTMLYSLYELGPVALVTFVFVSLQIIHFCLKWYRQERAYQRRKRAIAEGEETFPGPLR